MTRGKKKKETGRKNPRVNKELEGFEISINSFGEISSKVGIEKINEFLNRNLKDKKLNKPGKRKTKVKPKKRGHSTFPFLFSVVLSVLGLRSSQGRRQYVRDQKRSALGS